MNPTPGWFVRDAGRTRQWRAHVRGARPAGRRHQVSTLHHPGSSVPQRRRWYSADGRSRGHIAHHHRARANYGAIAYRNLAENDGSVTNDDIAAEPRVDARVRWVSRSFFSEGHVVQHRAVVAQYRPSPDHYAQGMLGNQPSTDGASMSDLPAGRAEVQEVNDSRRTSSLFFLQSELHPQKPHEGQPRLSEYLQDSSNPARRWCWRHKTPQIDLKIGPATPHGALPSGLVSRRLPP